MNKENLQLMSDHIKTIPQELFDMSGYRRSYDSYDYRKIECNSIGCVIGHCVQLDPEYKIIPRNKFNVIDFAKWSLNFTKIDGDEWGWCFGSSWSNVDNTPTGASKRIEYLINNGLPEDWEKQLEGESKLCYL